MGSVVLGVLEHIHLALLMSLLLALFGTNQIDSTENICNKQDVYSLLLMLGLLKLSVLTFSKQSWW